VLRGDVYMLLYLITVGSPEICHVHLTVCLHAKAVAVRFCACLTAASCNLFANISVSSCFGVSATLLIRGTAYKGNLCPRFMHTVLRLIYKTTLTVCLADNQDVLVVT